MNDQDYIREAAELADGWSIVLQMWGWDVVGPDPLAAYESCEPIPQPITDALAAQLVRQVDEMAETFFYFSPTGAAFVYTSLEDKPAGASRDLDRSMNTIRCIVDSGVLK